MKPFRTFDVSPQLPPKLEFLREVAYNLWWTWNPKAISLFRRLDPELWESTNHNPVMLLSKIPQEKLEAAEEDEGFISSLHELYHEYNKYFENQTTWFSSLSLTPSNLLVAYFSAEYGITECLPLYSGGLGILAGDHLKSSSELGLPIIGVGILYEKGYFQQYLNRDGWQQEKYPVADYSLIPIKTIRADDNLPVILDLDFPDRKIYFQLWEAKIGKSALILLDTNIEQNSQEDQDLTDYLYGGDIEVRLCQEFILGIGGVKALRRIGKTPTVFHMNEGHSAFLTIERIKNLMEDHKISFHEAKEAICSSSIFTTHTPVAAGSDYFPPELILKYFRKYIEKFTISEEEFLALGRQNPSDSAEYFCMTTLAMKLSYYHNGVSNLHREISRKLWRGVWPDAEKEEVPIESITNGVFHKSWVSYDFTELYNRYLGPRWAETPWEAEVWNRVDQIPDEELWRTHERRKERLIAFVRRRLARQLEQKHASKPEIDSVSEILDPKALTIGFARRFAKYKRANLLFKDIERLRKILSNDEKPVQIIFAGKAHPKDEEGKEIIRSIIHICREYPFNKRIAFIEDYDMNVARYLVQGCDIWLNNPRRPLEASGTSGMKAAVNGVINFSVLDGWWAEAYEPSIGWGIGQGETYENDEYCDMIESRYLYDILEKEIIPLFFDRKGDLLPRGWVAKMKNAIKKICPVFNTNRMVRDYTEKFYIPADTRSYILSKENFEGAKRLASWKKKIRCNWDKIKIIKVETNIEKIQPKVGDTIDFAMEIELNGDIDVKDVKVEIIHGKIDVSGNIQEMEKEKAEFVQKTERNTYIYEGKIKCRKSGRRAWAVRIIPDHELIKEHSEICLTRWWK